MNKYKQNLSIVHVDGKDYVRSYSTLVAEINHAERQIIQLGYWSMTTQKTY